jgi:Sap, sulfolipid-1-addressing protein
MLSPTTLSFSVLALVLGDRPLRTGLWFYLGALSVMLAIGVVAAFVIGDVAATSASTSTPKTWVAVVDVIAGALLLVVVDRPRFDGAEAQRRTRLAYSTPGPWRP